MCFVAVSDDGTEESAYLSIHAHEFSYVTTFFFIRLSMNIYYAVNSNLLWHRI